MPVPMPRGSGLILTWLPVVCRYTSTASGFGRTVYRVTTTWARASEITTVQTSNLLFGRHGGFGKAKNISIRPYQELAFAPRRFEDTTRR